MLNLTEDSEYRPGDRRAVLDALAAAGIEERRLRLTDYGWATHDKGILARLEAEERLLKGVAPAERERLVALLRTMIGRSPWGPADPIPCPSNKLR